jgi:DNA repair protein RadC
MKTDRIEIKERLQEYGVAALNNAEIISLLTRTDTATARDILSRIGGLEAIAKMSLEELKHYMTPSAADSIKTALDFANRINKATRNEKQVISSPETAYNYLSPILRYEQVEKFVCIFLNTKNKILAHEIISIGTLNSTIVHPREVYNRAIAHRASAIIVAHNHPSGDPTPSAADIEMTERLKNAGEIIGIDLLDHVIIGDSSYVSLKEGGLF